MPRKPKWSEDDARQRARAKRLADRRERAAQRAKQRRLSPADRRPHITETDMMFDATAAVAAVVDRSWHGQTSMGL